MKTSKQGFESVKIFLETLNNYNSNMVVYGSDHCVNEYNGITVKEAIKKTKYNSRDKLWMEIRE
jgi:predicted TIM-barrel fold metal-dependent hydrolase